MPHNWKHRLKSVTVIALRICSVLLCVEAPGHADILFFDDFQSYAIGSNLMGQGGWTGCGVIPIGSSSHLASNVARADLGFPGCFSGPKNGYAYIGQPLTDSIQSTGVTLTFNAYAPDGSHNIGLALTNNVDNVENGVYLYTDSANAGWHFSLYQNGTAMFHSLIGGGVGVPAFFQVVVDSPNEMAFAIYDFGSGPQTTASLTLVGNTTLDQWRTLALYADYRSTNPQAEFDNIVLREGVPGSTGLPEPSSVLLTGAGIAALLVALRKRAPSF